MKTYKILVEYNRGGKIWRDAWFHTGDNEQKAIANVKKEWHALNDPLFLEAKDAEFFIKVD